MRDEVIQAALAGLLHDIGKLAQRAGESSSSKDSEYKAHAILSDEFVKQFVPKHLQKGLFGVLAHHAPQDDASRRIQIADHLAAKKRRTGAEDPKEARLLSILANVQLKTEPRKGVRHCLAPLSIVNKDTYPVEGKEGDYRALWKQMKKELEKWQENMGEEWHKLSAEKYFFTLQAIFQKYLWCVPSATPWQKDEQEKPKRNWPDVSLYDHNRVTSAIAACIAFDNSLPDENGNEPVALLVRGDVSGIQDFIYRLNRPQAETEHIAKRLRGRSFYLQLLTEVVVDWILQTVGLPESCAIFVGGGKFDLLLPLKAQDELEKLKTQLSDWLLEEFQAEIALLIAAEPAAPQDFEDTRAIFRRLDEKLETLKRQKWLHRLNNLPGLPSGNQHVSRSRQNLWHVCSVCQLTPMEDSGQICVLCELHANIGKHLPHTRYLAYCYCDVPEFDQKQMINFSQFGVRVALVRDERDLGILKRYKDNVKLFAINQTVDFIVPPLPTAFRFLANTAPKALKKHHEDDEQPIEEGDVLHFEAIAKLSKGAKRIGILKADVDLLGLVMSEGLVEDDPGKSPQSLWRPTLSRFAALSRMLDLFFAGHLNRICREVYDQWMQQEENANKKPKADNLFYILYSGGDDLFVVGPWDQVLNLALEICKQFSEFCGHNRNLTLSAGYVQVKPRYPTQKFASLVDEQEKLAKEERNRIAAFETALAWTDNDLSNKSTQISFEWALAQAMEWAQDIENKQLSSGLIYDLGTIFRQHIDKKEKKLTPMWTPRLYYTLVRRMKPDLRKKYENTMVQTIISQKVLVPVSIASLYTRKE
ncbi:MAG: type III-A CRISPR-associated protein Cas10/Csm1 [Anaerolineales bacterium]